MASSCTAPLQRTAPTHSSSSLSTGLPASDPGGAAGTLEDSPLQPANHPFTFPHAAPQGARGPAEEHNMDKEAGSACMLKGNREPHGAAQEDHRENLDAQSFASFVVTECPALEPTEASQQLRKPPVLRSGFFKHAAQFSSAADRVMVLLWRAFTFRLRYPFMTLIGLLAPVALVASACIILAHYQNVELNYVPTNMSRGPNMSCNFASYMNRVSKMAQDSNLCTPPSSLMASFGRRYDGLHLMYLPLVLHYGGLLAFVDKGGTDCQQLRLFMEKFAQTVSPYLMKHTTENNLFKTFPSEKALDKYRRAAAAQKERPIHSAFVCRATERGQLDVTIRMHVRRGTPRSFVNDAVKFLRRHYTSYNSTTYFGGASFLLEADVIGTPNEGKPYGHLTGGFLDLITLVHVFNLDRSKVRELPSGSPVSQEFQPQWERISEAFFKMFDYFGRLPVLDSIAFSTNRKTLLKSFVEESERNLAEMLTLVFCISAANEPASPKGISQMYRHLLPAWVLGPGYGVVRLFTMRAAAAGCDPSTPSMQVLERLFYSRTHRMGIGLIVAAVGPLQSILRNVSTPVRRAYSPLNFLESAMPFVPATVISRSGKPHSCAAPFVVLFVCILWQVVKAIMVDKETGFKNMLKILGISDRVLWTSWYLFFTLYNLPTLIAVAFISHYYAFTLSDIWFVILLFLLALTASISFALFVTALFTDGNLAAMAACAWYVLIWVPVVCQRFGSAAWNPLLQQLFMVVCPAAALGVGIDIAWIFNEPYIGGIRRSTVHTSSLGITLADTYITLSISTVVFACLGAYLHKIQPTSSGSPKHPLFFVSPVISCMRKSCLLCCLRRPPKDRQELQEIAEGPFCKLSRGSEDDGKPLLEVCGVHKNFRTWKTKKCSRGSVKAVRGVSFSVYRDEIFGLLGQNGAGKSTLISVITGSLAATSGDVLIGGVSVRQHPSHARCNIGYCPQFDVLLPYLTIEETLWLYAALRGIPRGRRREEVAELMSMMQLSEMAKVQVAALSGGWRRRVSSSVAFLGDPTIVFLDEPTAGKAHAAFCMDILYRRTFWDSVRVLSRGRCIVLITHMMEEADYLCDRLAIMVDGVIASEGTALTLKSRFGSGYIISVVFLKQAKREEQQAQKKLRRLLQTFEYPPTITEVSRHELRIVCPFCHSFQLPRLFSELEINAHHYGVESAVLGFASLEEVFLNVVKLAARGRALEATRTDGSNSHSKPSQVSNVARSGASSNSCSSSANGRCSSPAYRVSALPHERTAVAPAQNTHDGHVNGSQPLKVVQLPPPIVLLVAPVGSHPTKNGGALDEDCGGSLLLFEHCWPSGFAFFIGEIGATRAPEWTTVIRIPPPKKHPFGGAPYMTHNNISSNVKNNNDMYEFLLNGYFGPHSPRFGAYVAPEGQADLSDEAGQLEVTIWHNSTFRDSIPLHYSHLLNCLAQDRTGIPNAVFLSNHPFEDTDDKSMDGLVVGFFTVIAYSFVAAGVGKVCIVERVRKVRHQQILAQVTPFQYWISSYIVDMVLLLLPCSIIFGMILWVDITPLVGPHQRGAFLLGTVLFCFSVCPLGYAISMGLDSPMTFVIVMLLLGWSLPSIQALFTEVSGLQGMYSQYLRYVFMLLPHAAFCELLTNLAMMNQLTGGDVKAKELVNWFEFRKTGCPLLYLGLTILLNWMICIAVDWAINYPMSRARMLTSVRRFVVSLVTSAARVLCGICSSCLCCLPDPKKRDSTTLRRDPPGASRNSGLRTMRTDIDAVFFRRRNASRSLGLNVQEEETESARAVQQLRRRVRNGKSGLFPTSPISIEDPDRGEEGARNNEADGVELPLVVHRLEKTYPPPILQRCFYCLYPLSINGSGKSTTFNILGSLMPQSAGSVFVGGFDILQQTRKARAKLRYCPQTGTDALLPTLTGAEHVYLYGCLLGLRRHQLRDFCSDFFEVIGCKNHMHTLVKSYSGGTKRKLSLGIAMLGEVDLLLLDEPTSGVDPESRQILWRMIEEAKNCQTSGKAIVLTSHSMEECEVLADRVGIIHKGKMLCLGTPAELRSTYGHGYQIECVFVAAAVSRDPSLPRRFISALQKTLPTLRVLHRMAYKVTASVAKGAVSLATIFCEVEAAKAPFAVEAYVVSETTLEEVFVEVSLRADRKAVQF
ncbi:ABC transporter family protein, related [Eimeria maxima]|uniref:ABC transporter family protein, related n=1 Tax=Eimeria maxima TaxID=5804 RepID=U6M132_EIMMA|nr:ABC transporter family protein, related [Eimeria maxima]CDJ57706.1 ABC transporter family protein, related [Eimeria maxima]